MTSPAIGTQLQSLLDEGLGARLYSGAAAGVSIAGERVLAYAGTHAYDDPTPVTPASLFDLASVSKTITAAVLARLAAQGRIDLDQPVAGILPVGRGAGAEDITLRMLLTHVSGLPAESFVWRDETLSPEDRLERVISAPLESRPGDVHRYSCVGYIAAGAVAELTTARALTDLVEELVATPLGLDSLSYGPVDPARAVATEAQPWAGRGMLRGEVHDELNRSLGGRAGNAGLFATAADVLRFAEAFLGEGPLEPAALAALTTDVMGGVRGAQYGQALGPRIRDREFLGDVDGLGHIGFTGTMWFADVCRGVAGTLLTNRVHPERDRVDLSAFQRRFAAWADALGAER